jgi:hypothetical protein
VNITVIVFPLALVVTSAVAIPVSTVQLPRMPLVPWGEKASAFWIPAKADVINVKKALLICL